MRNFPSGSDMGTSWPDPMWDPHLVQLPYVGRGLVVEPGGTPGPRPLRNTAEASLMAGGSSVQLRAAGPCSGSGAALFSHRGLSVELRRLI